MVQCGDCVLFSSSAVETNAGNAAEDPGADAHAERGVLTAFTVTSGALPRYH